MSIYLTRVARVLDKKQIHILMGNFNVDVLDHGANQRLRDILESYDFIVSRPTHLDGGLF